MVANIYKYTKTAGEILFFKAPSLIYCGTNWA